MDEAHPFGGGEEVGGKRGGPSAALLLYRMRFYIQTTLTDNQDERFSPVPLMVFYSSPTGERGPLRAKRKKGPIMSNKEDMDPKANDSDAKTMILYLMDPSSSNDGLCISDREAHLNKVGEWSIERVASTI